MKKILAMLLVVAMVLSMVACGSKTTPSTEAATTPVATEAPAAGESVEYVSPYAGIEDYDELSEAIYYDILGEFYETYTAANEYETLSERYVKQAIAEAKLMEAAVMLPIYSAGGNYAMNRRAPYTYPTVGWGYSDIRFNTALVCEEPIVSEDYIEMKVKWAELQGTGEYYAWAKQYLVDKGYTLKDSYTYNASMQPDTWDCLASSRSTVGESVGPTWESLITYDCENMIAPGMAESWEKTSNADGSVTYTFHIREGAVWVDSQGRELAPVTAHDYVTGLHHAMDAAGGLEFLVEGVVKNTFEYNTGAIADFAEVGVKAVDDYTLVYELVYDCPFFMSALNYSVYAPLNREFYESKGGKFGEEYDASAADYVYGSTPDDIAYCGPFLCTNYTQKSTIAYVANEKYWDYANMSLKTLTVLYNDGSDVTKNVNDFMSDVIDGTGLSSATVEIAKAQALPADYVSAKGATTWYDEYSYIADTNDTSYMGFLNVNRAATANVNDGAVVSPQTEEDVARANAALQNVHFRRAFCMSVDRGAYNAQSVGEELKYVALRNTYTPWYFVNITEDVTVDINGTATTFAAGTKYAQVMQAQIDADGVAITVWNPSANDGIGSGDGYDGWYNPENAAAELAIAIEELAAQGIEVSAENPIYIDLPQAAFNPTRVNMTNAVKQSVEAALGGAVIVNLTICNSADEWYYTGYDTNFGYEANYNMYDLSGWGPDYGDPQTYLDTFLPDYAGYMIKCIGIY